MDDERLIRTTLSTEMGQLLGIESKTKSQAEAFTQAFLVNGMTTVTHKSVDDVIARKAVVLEYKRKNKDKKKTKKITTARKGTKKAKMLTAREKRKLKIFQIKPEHQRYELFLPLHELWKQYIRSLCNGLKPESHPMNVQAKLLKADFHGAILTVIRSKCPSYVGTTGILVQEFKHIFKIITKEDKLKVIPKKNSVFEVEINGFVSHIYGSKFEQRASERSAKKYKVKGSIDL